MKEAADSECRGWRSVADLLTTDETAAIALLGAPLSEKSLTPGRCDKAPKIIRETAQRFSVYDPDGGGVGAMRVFDAGDLRLKTLTPEEAFAPIRDRMRALVARRPLTILLGGNNAVTRPGVHALGDDLSRIGLITLDAHHDLRDTDCGLTNGNPVRALIEDGLPGRNIAQLGIAPFANTRRAHEFAVSQGVTVVTINQIRAEGGLSHWLRQSVDRISAHVDRIFFDFDIDVIDRSQCPGAPGARPGGLSATEFFEAARMVAARPKVAAVDLTEFDPMLDVSDITALTAARWLAEILAGASLRP